jgi:uncharacterized membrane protein (DUF485 family)
MMGSNYVKGKLGMLVAKRVQANVRMVVAMIVTLAVFVVLFAGSSAFAATNTANTITHIDFVTKFVCFLLQYLNTAVTSYLQNVQILFNGISQRRIH